MKGLGRAGYTVFEVMIVLAVSISLFFAVAGLLSGKQGKAETTQAVRDIESKIQSVANDVTNGYYPSQTSYSCVVATPFVTGSPVSFNATPKAQGTNQGCISIGKVMAFDTKDMDIITLVGRQYTGTGSAVGPDVSNITDAHPIAVAQAGGPDVTENYVYRYDMKVTKMVQLSDNATSVSAIGFVTQFGGAIGSPSPLSGSRSVLLYGMSGSTPNSNNTAALATNINVSGSLYPLPDGVRICFTGGNGQKAEITVGANGNQTSTVTAIDNGVNSVCP